jgi:hypothetical protein
MGVGEMICAVASSNVSLEDMHKLIDKAALEARLSREKNLVIVILAPNTKEVFKYRDAFTKYIDLGVRLYYDNNVEKMQKLLSNCKKIFCLQNDVQKLNISNAICV